MLPQLHLLQTPQRHRAFWRLDVPEGHAAVVHRHGAYWKTLPRGRHVLLRAVTWTLVDLRESILVIPGQELLTQDQVAIKVSVAVRYRVTDPERALHVVRSHTEALYLETQLATRALIATREVDALLSERGELGAQALERIASAARAWGLEVSSVALKDLMLAGELKRAFAEVVRARKEGQAALEKARGESAALRSLVNAARLMQDVPALQNLRLLQALGPNQTVVLGVPQGLVPLGTPRVKLQADGDGQSSEE